MTSDFKERNLYDYIINCLKNNLIIVIILIVSVFIINLDKLITALDNIKSRFHKEPLEQPILDNNTIDTNNLKNPKINSISTKSSLVQKHNLSILSKESGSIYIDKKYFGKTNKTINLAKGSYELMVQFNDTFYRDVINIPEQMIISIQ